MKRNKNFTASRRLQANNQRRSMLKRMHMKVLARRKQFALSELSEASELPELPERIETVDSTKELTKECNPSC